jgi:hypothetical protein
MRQFIRFMIDFVNGVYFIVVFTVVVVSTIVLYEKLPVYWKLGGSAFFMFFSCLLLAYLIFGFIKDRH